MGMVFFSRGKLCVFLWSFFFLSFSSVSFANVWRDFTSPFNTKGGHIFYPGMLATGIVAFHEHREFSQKVKNTVQKETSISAKRVYHWGDALGNGYLNGAYFLGALMLKRHDLSKHIFKASLYSTVATWALKLTVRERRPNGASHVSFPSGHSSLAFAFSTVVFLRHSLGWGLAAMGVSSFIAYSRMVDNAHWFHDVIGGITIGASYAVGLYCVEKGYGDLGWSLLPSRDGKGLTGRLVYNF